MYNLWLQYVIVFNFQQLWVLWTHSVGLSSDMIDTTIASFSDNDKVDKKNLSILFNSALADLPDAK
ncbi:MAG: hypothetical protein ACEY3E_04335 [Candidatus Tisiphia sp.]